MKKYHLDGSVVSTVLEHLERYIKRIPDAERQDYFDPRNRDTWMEGFAEYLLERKRKALGASND